jgi:hypothetical protein
MPPQPWTVRNATVEKPFSARDIPLVSEAVRANLERNYAPAHAPKALALSPRGNIAFFINQSSSAEATRRALELCGLNGGVPCAVVATDDVLAVAVPATMKVTGFFRPANASTIAADQREGVARRLADAGDGWSAVAVGAAGHADVSVKAGKEEEATAAALVDCAGHDKNCRVIAIGMFAVEPN